MQNEVMVMAPDAAPVELYGGAQAKVSKTANGYRVTAPGGNYVVLKKGVDFGEVQGRECIFKGGAEKLALAYGMLQHYTVESCCERFDGDDPFFFYRVRCDLVKVAANGQEYVFSTGRGTANSKEKGNALRSGGMQNPFDTANKNLKMAHKRALCSAAIALAGASDLLTMDIDDDMVVTQASALANESDQEAKLTKAQLKAMYDIAEKRGYSVHETWNKLKEAGFGKPSELRNKDYDAVIALFNDESK